MPDNLRGRLRDLLSLVRCQVLMQLAQVQEAVDAAEQMVRGNMLFEVEDMEG